MARNNDTKKKKSGGLSVGFVSSDTPTNGRDLKKSDGSKYNGREGRIDNPRDYTKSGNPEISSSEWSRLSDKQTGLNARRYNLEAPEGETLNKGQQERKDFEKNLYDKIYLEKQQMKSDNIQKQREANPEAYAAYDKAKQEYYDKEESNESPFETPEERDTRSGLRKIMDNPATPVALGVGILALLTGGAAAGLAGGAAAGASITGTTAAGATFVEGAVTAETLATTAATLPTSAAAITGATTAKAAAWGLAGHGLKTFMGTNLGMAITGATIIGGAVSAADNIGTWFAADNLRSSIPFQLNDVVTGYQNGAITIQEANQYFEQAEQLKTYTDEAIDTSTALNPSLWAARNRFKAGNPAIDTSIELKRLQLTQSQGGY